MNREKMIYILEKIDEGNKPKVYPDSKGIPTIGIGRNLQDKGLSKDEVYYLVNNDLDEVEGDLDHALPWWRRLDDRRGRVLANMCFQMGIGRLMKFEKMLAHCMIGQYGEAAAEMMDSQWAREDSPKRALRLAEEMRHGGSDDVASNS